MPNIEVYKHKLSILTAERAELKQQQADKQRLLESFNSYIKITDELTKTKIEQEEVTKTVNYTEQFITDRDNKIERKKAEINKWNNLLQQKDKEANFNKSNITKKIKELQKKIKELQKEKQKDEKPLFEKLNQQKLQQHANETKQKKLVINKKHELNTISELLLNIENKEQLQHLELLKNQLQETQQTIKNKIIEQKEIYNDIKNLQRDLNKKDQEIDQFEKQLLKLKKIQQKQDENFQELTSIEKQLQENTQNQKTNQDLLQKLQSEQQKLEENQVELKKDIDQQQEQLANNEKKLQNLQGQHTQQNISEICKDLEVREQELKSIIKLEDDQITWINTYEIGQRKIQKANTIDSLKSLHFTRNEIEKNLKKNKIGRFLALICSFGCYNKNKWLKADLTITNRQIKNKTDILKINSTQDKINELQNDQSINKEEKLNQFKMLKSEIDQSVQKEIQTNNTSVDNHYDTDGIQNVQTNSIIENLTNYEDKSLELICQNLESYKDKIKQECESLEQLVSAKRNNLKFKKQELIKIQEQLPSLQKTNKKVKQLQQEKQQLELELMKNEASYQDNNDSLQKTIKTLQNYKEENLKIAQLIKQQKQNLIKIKNKLQIAEKQISTLNIPTDANEQQEQAITNKKAKNQLEQTILKKEQRENDLVTQISAKKDDCQQQETKIETIEQEILQKKEAILMDIDASNIDIIKEKRSKIEQEIKESEKEVAKKIATLTSKITGQEKILQVLSTSNNKDQSQNQEMGLTF